MKFDFVIHGLGNIGRKHFRILKQLKFSKILTINRKQSKKLLVDKIREQKIIISTNSNSHIDIALKYAKNNNHIFIEKPISNTFNHKDKINEVKRLMNRNKKIIQVGYCLKFLDSAKFFFSIFKKLKKNEKIININLSSTSNLKNWGKLSGKKIHPALSNQKGGGVILELSHELDLILWIFGDIKKVLCINNKNFKIKDSVESWASGKFFFKNYSCTYFLNFKSNYNSRYIEVLTNMRLIKWDIINETVYINEKKHYQSKQKSKDYMYIKQMKYFLNLSKNYNQIHNNNLIKNNIKILKIIESMKKSNRLKELIDIK